MYSPLLVEPKGIGIRIEERMLVKDYNMTDVARKIRVNRQKVVEWVHGIRAIKSDDLIKLCDLLECSADYLLGRTDTVD